MFEIFYRRNRMPTARVLKATENAYNKRRMKLLGEIEKLLLGTGAADVTRVQYTVIDGKGGYFQNVKRLKEFSSERIVFQGKSGCGKSTLLKLLMRMWDVDEGRILIDEKSIQGINTRSLRRHESYVAQETVLFHDSIARNLRIAKADASDEELVAACKKASIHDFIMSLPQGYDTPVAELGSSVSGGER